MASSIKSIILLVVLLLSILVFPCVANLNSPSTKGVAYSLSAQSKVGIITTVAGNSQKDFSEDNEPAINASLNRPIAIDSSGNIFIADAENGRIRKIAFDIEPSQSFKLNASPRSQTISPGTTTSFNVSLQAINGFNSPVNLVAELEQPNNNISISFSNSTINPTQTSTCRIGTMRNLLPSIYNVTIKATFEKITMSSKASLSVVEEPGFQIGVRNSSGDTSEIQKILAGTTAFYTITIVPFGGFNRGVLISGNPEFANDWIIVKFNPMSITPSQSSQMSVSTSPSLKPRTYSINVMGESGNLVGTTKIKLIVVNEGGDFSLIITSPSQKIKAGSQEDFRIRVEPIGNFLTNVTFSPPIFNNTGVIASISPASVPPKGEAIMTVPPNPGATGVTTIRVVAQSGTLTQSATANVEIIEPDFSVGFDQPTLEVQAGKAVKVVVKVNRDAGFVSNVKVSVDKDALKKEKIILKNPNPQSTSGSEVIFDFKVKATASPSSKSIAFMATDGSNKPPRVNTLTLIITTPK